jgi:hypothetical protein
MGKQFLPATRGYPRSGISRGPEPRSTFLSDLGAAPETAAGLINNVQPTQLNPVPTVDPITGNPTLPPTQPTQCAIQSGQGMPNIQGMGLGGNIQRMR